MKISKDKDQIEKLLNRGVENVYPSKDFLKSRLESGEQLSLYLGIDPTGPDLHLGHAIVLKKMREFQDLGHKLILLIGDFTGMIGDPTDKGATRVRQTREEVLENAKNYAKQAEMILSKENPAEIKYNSEWLSKLTFEEVVDLSSNFTVQQMLERDMFDKRMKEGKPIYFHEFMYPLMQGYDSVAMDVDGEIGGNDQMFNMMAGRDLMKALKNKEKFVVTTKLLTDSTGKKMGKSEGNIIKLDDSPEEMFGKVMSWTDGMIGLGFELLTNVSEEEMKKIEKDLEGDANPRDVKARLGREVVAFFHDEDSAEAASKAFDDLFKNKKAPTDVPELSIKKEMSIVDVLIEAGLASSISDARRVIQGRGVKIDGEVVESHETMVAGSKKGVLVQKGKRFFVRVTN
jgi:tyrosyl-tRNA synthetase